MPVVHGTGQGRSEDGDGRDDKKDQSHLGSSIAPHPLKIERPEDGYHQVSHEEEDQADAGQDKHPIAEDGKVQQGRLLFGLVDDESEKG